MTYIPNHQSLFIQAINKPIFHKSKRHIQEREKEKQFTFFFFIYQFLCEKLCLVLELFPFFLIIFCLLHLKNFASFENHTKLYLHIFQVKSYYNLVTPDPQINQPTLFYNQAYQKQHLVFPQRLLCPFIIAVSFQIPVNQIV